MSAMSTVEAVLGVALIWIAIDVVIVWLVSR